MTLPLVIPRVADLREFYQDPLTFLTQARAEFGDIFVLREGAPVFSRYPECAGAIAVFGSANQQAVLTDTEFFGMPVSVAQHLVLPANLVNLNRSLHSMRGEQHDQQQRLLLHVLSDGGLQDRHDAITAELEQFIQRWHYGQKIPLLSEMRRLTLALSTRYLFGERYEERTTLATLADKFFHSRREVTSTLSSPTEAALAELVELGSSLDEAIRRHLRWSRQQSGTSADGLLAKLAGLAGRPGTPLSEDEMVGHANVLFMSNNEPLAVALTWTLLVLSQQADLRKSLRNELRQGSPESLPSLNALSRLSLLDSVINESLRLLTPNAMMSRVTTRAGSLNGVPLPERCEVVLCPLVAHRDPEVFPRPNEFLPARWQTARPSPFEYFPFGAGGHACVGRSLALHVLKATLALLIRKFEVVLAGDQEIDWQVHIIFMPGSDPIMNLQNPGTAGHKVGTLLGPVRDLIGF